MSEQDNIFPCIKAARIRVRTAQVAVEFVVLINTAFLLLLIFTVAIREHSATLKDEEEFRKIQDVTYTLSGEIGSATYVTDGYSRTFIVQNISDGYAFSARIDNDYIIVNSTNHEYMVAIPHVEGQLLRGENTLRRTGGVIYLNS